MRSELGLVGDAKLVLKALIPVLKDFPVLNASLDEAAGEIVFKEYFHIGVAVDTELGLFVPVLRDVDRKSMLDISKEIEALAARIVAFVEKHGVPVRS